MADTETVTRYAARAARDSSGIWVGTVPALRGVVTQARTLARLRENLAEAVALWQEVERLDQGERNPKIDPRSIAITLDEVVLPASVMQVAEAAQRLRQEAAEAEAEALAATLAAIEELSAAGLSQRDTADILNLSHQRIGQLLASKAGGRPDEDPRPVGNI